MAKVKSRYVCQNCGYETAGYLGKCPECGSWASFVEEIAGSEIKVSNVELLDKNPPMKLTEIEMNSEIRTTTGISEFDRVLGGLLSGNSIEVDFEPTPSSSSTKDDQELHSGHLPK